MTCTIMTKNWTIQSRWSNSHKIWWEWVNLTSSWPWEETIVIVIRRAAQSRNFILIVGCQASCQGVYLLPSDFLSSICFLFMYTYTRRVLSKMQQNCFYPNARIFYHWNNDKTMHNSMPSGYIRAAKLMTSINTALPNLNDSNPKCKP